jgi:hypothetical protein
MKKQDKLNIHYKVKSNLATYKELDESQRTVQLVANTYNFYDSDGDVLRMGCAKRSIDNRGANSKAYDKILHAKDHDLTQLPGKSILEAETTIDGNPVLYCETKLSESQDGEDLLIKYKEGIYNQHSIGFKYIQIEYIEADSEEWDIYIKELINPDLAIKEGFGWDVKEINLFEYSTVSYGANKLTPYLGVKSNNKTIQLSNLYTKLDALINKSKQGIKNKDIFNLQYLQLKQLINEIFTNSSDEDLSKDTILSNTLKEKEDSNYIKLLI